MVQPGCVYGSAPCFNAVVIGKLRDNLHPGWTVYLFTYGNSGNNLLSGMQRAVEHLIGLGHRELLFIQNLRGIDGLALCSHLLREEGVAAAVNGCRPLRIKVHTLDIPGISGDAGEQAVQQALDRWRFTGIVALTDTVAMGAYRGLQKRGLHVPKDVSVVGFDDAYFCRFLNPPLTTVRISRQELSRISIEVLLSAHTDPRKKQTRTMETMLVLRESTAPPAG